MGYDTIAPTVSESEDKTTDLPALLSRLFPSDPMMAWLATATWHRRPGGLLQIPQIVGGPYVYYEGTPGSGDTERFAYQAFMLPHALSGAGEAVPVPEDSRWHMLEVRLAEVQGRVTSLDESVKEIKADFKAFSDDTRKQLAELSGIRTTLKELNDFRQSAQDKLAEFMSDVKALKWLIGIVSPIVAAAVASVVAALVTHFLGKG